MGKSKYESHVKPHFEDIYYWYSHGRQLKWIANELGVAESTFMKYKNEQIELSDLLKKADKAKPRKIARKAELALNDKLQEHETEETHTEMWKDENGNTVKQHIKKVTKVIPADTTAIIFALKNSDPDRWNAGVEEANRRKLEAEAELAESKLQSDEQQTPQITIYDSWGRE
ncbi:MAG: hypothetical protein L0J33_01095 [Tetragenococcus halophilus]|nr:hypothetical protein [Tetragenococcus halophilus]